MSAVGILLAAGRGRRFDPGGAANKLLQTLPDGELVVVASARALLAVLARVVAVVRPGDAAVAQALHALGCEVTVCANADSGMGASLVHAVRHSLPHASGWVVALGDMPYVRASTIERLCDALDAGAAIAVPTFEGRRGNPIAFGRQHLPALLALTGDAGARAIVQANPVMRVAVPDPGIAQDIDKPSDILNQLTHDGHGKENEEDHEKT